LLGNHDLRRGLGLGASKEESRKIFDAFVEAGGNFIDTANAYTGGTSAKYVGEFIAPSRERVVLATKYTNSLPTADPNGAGNHRKSMVQSVEGSLRRLGTDYIDLLWLHAWNFTTPAEEVMRAFDDLVRVGKILYVGVSDTPAWIVAQANTLADLRGWTPFIGLQVEYSLIERTAERELLPMARALDMGVTAWSPLASGLLTGKYSEKAIAHVEQSRAQEPKRLSHAMVSEFVQLSERNLRMANAVEKVAEAIGTTSAQVALNWGRQRDVIPIIGARKVSQVKDNLSCLGFTLSEEHLRRVNEVSKIDLGFPHEFLAPEGVRQFVYGGMLKLLDNHHRHQTF
jgi:aryl-alcohol dehydrogenase-like predicted oxidoreductase